LYVCANAHITADGGAPDAYRDSFAANRRPNRRTADTHCVVCDGHKPTANHDGATGGGR
jgi:hypothetical protein